MTVRITLVIEVPGTVEELTTEANKTLNDVDSHDPPVEITGFSEYDLVGMIYSGDLSAVPTIICPDCRTEEIE